MRWADTALLAALLWTLAAVLLPAQAAGSWIANARTPTLHQRGYGYATPWLKPRASTPTAGRAITRVAWRYSFQGPQDSRLRVALCGGGRCVDASRQRASSAAFAGLPVATPFRFYFLMPGHGRLRRLAGAPLQLVVNFR